VFRANRDGSERSVALKIGHDARERQRLADEAELLVSVDAETIAGVVDAGVMPEGAGEFAGRPYVALDWVDGAALDPRSVDAKDRERLALVVARDIGEALQALHAMGIAHGDVKPDNIVISGNVGSERAVLVDLGLGVSTSEPVPRGGTPRYLAPECFDPSRGGDARARDLWALGQTIAETASADFAALDDPRERIVPTSKLGRVEELVRALLSRTPAARPTADWATRNALQTLGDARDAASAARAFRRAVRRTYIGVRRRELWRRARGKILDVRSSGIVGAWLEETLAVLARISDLRGATASADREALGDLDSLGRARWLTALVGAPAASWPLPANVSDSEIADRLAARAAMGEPHYLVHADLLDWETTRLDPENDDIVSIAIALGRAAPSPRLVDAAERLLGLRKDAAALALPLGRSLRLRGQLGRALSVLERAHSDEARVEAAECARRAGDGSRAEQLLASVAPLQSTPVVRARWLSTRARMVLDAGDPQAALSVLEPAAPAVPVLEVRALAALALGKFEAAHLEAERGLVLSVDDEERARLEAVLGNVAHATGESAKALEAFRRARDHAVRAGALLEEATYLTGVAASGFEAGELGEALAAATRATLLFEHLGRPADAARAILARAATFAAAGADVLAKEAANDAIFRARSAGDARCRAFAHLVLADVAAADDPDGLEHAERARTLLASDVEDDRLRVGSRVLRHGGNVDAAALDRTGEDATVSVPARLEWWGARAVALAKDRAPERPDRVISALTALASVSAPVSTRAEALAAGVALAARVGDGEAARRFATATAEAARVLVRGAPPELRSGILALDWVIGARAPRESTLLPEQIADVETLVRALGTRDNLRALFDEVLDALVLWTGVERGLLLLRAPEGKLVPRAARNIARHDLRGTQLALSHSLAERALGSGEPVVAVDAAGELPEVHASVHALKLRSVLAVPLLARGEALGVVYLDDRVRRGAFGPSELAWVKLVAALAAVAIADARDQLALRRAARRATRAEQRLAASLAQREAQLDMAERELARTRRTTRFAYDDIVGDSEPVRALLGLVDRVTPTEVPVLITGESGSGKELVAQAIHRNGPRAGGPFVGENCSALPEGLLESILFGHVRGAFTGAGRPHAGLFEIANHGTLFLDEIGEMSLGMQTKLLRVLEDGEVRPVGSERARKVDVRIIAATHRDLGAMTDSGAFRRDLLYRLNVIRIDVPALRTRRGDIEVLARHFLRKHSPERDVRISRDALDRLVAFAWPGNIRQLENELRRALVLSDDVIRPEHLSVEVKDAGSLESIRSDGLNVRRRVDSLESELVRAALERTSGNQTRAAELLGLSRFGLQKMIRRLKIAVPSSSALRDAAGELTDGR
jgi:serine/threonine-protein kinase PknK